MVKQGKSTPEPWRLMSHESLSGFCVGLIRWSDVPRKVKVATYLMQDDRHWDEAEFQPLWVWDASARSVWGLEFQVPDLPRWPRSAALRTLVNCWRVSSFLSGITVRGISEHEETCVRHWISHGRPRQSQASVSQADRSPLHSLHGDRVLSLLRHVLVSQPSIGQADSFVHICWAIHQQMTLPFCRRKKYNR